jgi:hypothetical protein
MALTCGVDGSDGGGIGGGGCGAHGPMPVGMLAFNVTVVRTVLTAHWHGGGRPTRLFIFFSK